MIPDEKPLAVAQHMLANVAASPYLSRSFKQKFIMDGNHDRLVYKYSRDADWAQHQSNMKIMRDRVVRFLENMAFVAIGAAVAWFFF